MVNYSIIQKSQLEGALRLDAEYYQPEYLKIRKNIEDIGFLNFKEIIVYFGSGKNLSQTNEKKFTKFIRTQNIKPVIIKKEGVSFTEEKIYPKLDYGDLLFVRVGEGVGNSSVVTRNFQGSTFSDNVIRVKIKKVNPFYVSVLLNSRIGSLLMEQVKKGSARSLISKENLNLLKIPKISRTEQIYFEKIINRIESLIKDSESLYQQAEDLLLGELGLKDFQSENDLTYVINFSETELASRLDAEYFQPRYEKIKSKIKNLEFKKLGDVVSIKKGIEPGSEIYREEGIPFVRVSNISKFGIKDDNQQYFSQENYDKFKDNFEPKMGEILLTKDATPGIAYYLDDKLEGIVSGGILRLKPKIEIESEYLALVINSIIGQMQKEQDAGGSIIKHWRPEQIKNCLIPILSKSTQRKIADLVCQSRIAREKAKQLLEQAKQEVEDLIEKGGETDNGK